MHRHLRSPPSPPLLRRLTPHPTANATAATTASTAAVFPTAAAAVVGCGRQNGSHRRGMSKKGLSAAAPPLWWRSDDGTPPQPHFVVSGCDGATPCGTTGWYMLPSLDGAERGYRRTWTW
nr:hypothetical protein [Tanacetum cinerariifolium]